jgi:hypothetical protein
MADKWRYGSGWRGTAIKGYVAAHGVATNTLSDDFGNHFDSVLRAPIGVRHIGHAKQRTKLMRQLVTHGHFAGRARGGALLCLNKTRRERTTSAFPACTN